MPARAMKKHPGNCYAASEAIYHITGADAGPWRPHVMRVGRATHWFLRHRFTGEVLDPSVRQFQTLPSYLRGRGCGFLTKRPSKAAQDLINRLTYKEGSCPARS